MIELFQYDFVIRAFIAGIITAITSAVLGNFVVASRQSQVSEMLSHTAIAGVGLGIFWNFSPSILAMVSALVSAYILWFLIQKKDTAPEALSMMILSGGLAFALIFAHLNKNSAISLDSYLFGSILTITDSEVLFFSIINILVFIILLVFWKYFITLVFDKEFLKSKGTHHVYELLLISMIAILVGIGLKIMGGLMIGALLVIPALISQLFCSSFRMNVIWSVVWNVISVSAGITLSFYFDIPTSSSIVLCLIGLYVCLSIYVGMRKN
jgi:zinc transport system permease protein